MSQQASWLTGMKRSLSLCIPIAITLNLFSILAASLILREPHSSLWLRNIIFSIPKPLTEVSASVALPPSSVDNHIQNLSLDLPVLEQVRQLCNGRNSLCAAYTLAGYLATRSKNNDCVPYATQAELLHHVLSGRGCCSDVVKTFLLLLPSFGIQAREVHIPNHTSVEIWDPSVQRWVWIDPFIGYQAFQSENPLSHMDIYVSFQQGKNLEFRTIKSEWPNPITPTPNYEGHRPSYYQFLFYTPANSLNHSSPLSDTLGSLGLNHIIREIILYLSVKPPLTATASGFNLFLLISLRYLMLAFLLCWISSSLLSLAFLIISIKARSDTSEPT